MYSVITNSVCFFSWLIDPYTPICSIFLAFHLEWWLLGVPVLTTNARNSASQSATAPRKPNFCKGKLSSCALITLRENFILSGFGQQKDMQFEAKLKREFYSLVIPWQLSHCLYRWFDSLLILKQELFCNFEVEVRNSCHSTVFWFVYVFSREMHLLSTYCVLFSVKKYKDD